MAGKSDNSKSKNIYGEPDFNDVLSGNDANNKIYGDSGDDLLQGNEGNDHLFGEDGNDILEGGSGNDKLEGGAGDDVLEGGSGNDNVIAGEGDDQIIWSAGDRNDDVDGGEGEDTFTLNTSNTQQQTVQLDVNEDGELIVTINGDQGGEITLNSIENFDMQVGLGGANLVIGDVPDELFGGEPLDVGGGEDSDVIDTSGSTQAVSVDAGGGDDVVATGSGNDIIDGGAGNDSISGGEGTDVIMGGEGDDVIDAGVGDDQVVWKAGDGNDIVDGGDGFDALDLTLSDPVPNPDPTIPPPPPPAMDISADANGNVILTTSTGESLTVDGVEDIVINAAPAGSTITIGDLTGTDIAQDTLYFVGGAGVDSLDASATDRRINAQGMGGDDILLSGSGNDSLDGGAGDDYLNAGSGSGVDNVQGGTGNDTIAVTLGDEQGSDAIDIVDGGADNDTLEVTFVEDTPHDLFLSVNSNGDGTFSITSSDIDVDENIHVSNVENLTLNATESGLHFILNSLLDTSLAGNAVNFNGSEFNDFFDASNTDIAVNLYGNAGDDVLIGGSDSDFLDGGIGNDSLSGEGGDDLLIGGNGENILDGGSGYDTADFSGASAAVNVDMENNSTQGSAGTGSIVNIEAVTGSSFADTLTGNSLGNNLSGGDGDDVIDGGGGFDLIYGGEGDDTLTDVDGSFVSGLLSGDAGADHIDGTATYMNDASLNEDGVTGVNINLSNAAVDTDDDLVDDLAARTARDGYGDTDTFGANAQSVWASQFNDHVTGSDANQLIVTRGGNDTVNALGGNDTIRSGSGNDDYDGGDGFDTLQLVNDQFDVAGAPTLGSVVDLAAGTVTDGWGDSDTITNIENVQGSDLDDEITGDANDNTLLGRGGNDNVSGGEGNDFIGGWSGNDILSGGDGADTLYGASGDDTMSGGAGADTYQFTSEVGGENAFGHDTINDFDVAEDVLDLTPFEQYGAISQLNISEAGGNTTITVDADRSITLNGVSAGSLVAANFIFGGEPPPPPAYEGTEGDDILEGTNLDDVINGLGGNDRIAGLEGADTLDGGDDFDSADYSYDPSGVTVDLGAGTAIDGWGNSDTLSNFENIYGSIYGDTLTGDAGNNNIQGDFNNTPPFDPNNPFVPQGGDDIINAGAGDDSITPGRGLDSVDGGDGFDTLSLLGDQVNGLTNPGLTITYGTGYDLTVENPHTLEIENHTNIEYVVGSIAADTFIGNDQDNFFNGIIGNDYVDGGAGNDTFAISGSPEYVDLTLGEAVQSNAILGTVTLVNVENVIGSFNDWDDRLIGNASDNILEGHLGNDTLIGGAGNDTLNGGIATLLNRGTGDPGNDTVDYSYFDTGVGVTVNLETGTATDEFGDTDTLQSIENVTGTNYDDVIIGSDSDDFNFLRGLDGADILSGGAGNDFFFGGHGVDTIDGGAGFDTAYFTNDDVEVLGAGLEITFNNDGTITSYNTHTGETEILTSIERVQSSLGNDVIIGNDQDNFINPFFGDDFADGGLGNDTIMFNSGSGSTVNLATGTGTASFPGVATFTNFENILGGLGDDTLIGDSNDNVLDGITGNDTFIGGGGNDTLNGGVSILIESFASAFEADGGDTADYSQDGAGVTVNLATGNATDGSSGTDTLIDIENVVGSEFNDSLVGSDGDNMLEGIGGDDSLTGGAGADQFRLNDDGNDNAAFGHDVITDFNLADDVINLRDFSDINEFSQISALTSQDGSDTLITFDAGNSIRLQNINSGDLDSSHFNFVENLFIEGTENNDDLNGEEGNDTILAYGGNDQVYGNEGNDIIDGGSGSDQLYGGEGNDVIEAGGDWDNSYGEGGDDVITDSSGGGWLVGGAGNDILTGSANDWNELYGDEGDDVLIDPDGSGFLFGGPGNDSLDGRPNYREDPNGIIANMSGSHGDGLSWDVHGDGTVLVASRTALDGYGGTDILEAGAIHIEGSDFNDFILGSDEFSQDFQLRGGNDTAFGGDGNDWMRGGSGDDYLDGGPEWDGVQYWDNGDDPLGPVTQGVIVNLSDQDFDYGGASDALANTGIDGWGGIDTLLNFETVDGSHLDDILIGTDEHNWITGAEGNDSLFGGGEGDNLVGGPGDDYIDGGAGDWDTVWYHDWIETPSGIGVVVDLAAGTSTSVDFGNDTLVSIENVEGSQWADTITGDANNNSIRANDGDDVVYGGAGDDNLEGRIGNDQLFGDAGNDWLLGQEGDDLLDGGTGYDEVRYDGWSGTTSGVNIDMTNIVDAGGYTNVIATPDGFGGTDYLRNIERVSGTDHNDTIIGDGADNHFEGWAGNDNLVGGAGDDWLDGRDDFDTLDGGAGFDDLTGGENDDTLTGGTEGDVFHFSRFTNEGNPTSFGQDIITDFNVAEDTLDFNQVPEFTSLAAIQNLASEVDGNLVISFVSNDYGVDETNSITFESLTLADLPNMEIWFAPLNGTDGNDLLDGSDGGESIEAFGGNDVVNGNGGNDSIYGGAGDDQLNGGDGNDHFIGGSGNDTIDGGADWDHLSFWGSNEFQNSWQEPFNGVTINMSLASGQVVNDGFGSTDTLLNIEHISGTNHVDSFNGGSGNDHFNGHEGNDSIYGNDGDDYLSGDGGNDVIDGGAGNDSVFGSQGDDIVSGGIGSDWVQGGSGNDTVSGGADSDHDSISFGAWDDFGNPTDFGHDKVTDFDPLNDRLDFYENNVQDGDITFTDDVGDLLLSVDANNSVRLTGLAGTNPADLNISYAPIIGSDGDDVWGGSSADEQYEGLAGNDTINGNDGNDSLYGGSGNDTINGGQGQDNIGGGSGDDFIDGGEGGLFDWDNVDYNVRDNDNGSQPFIQGIVMNLSGTAFDYGSGIANANEVLDPFGDVDQIFGIESVWGTDMDDIIIGSEEHNWLNGNWGDDIIYGQGDGDTLVGDQGNDTLVGTVGGFNHQAFYDTGAAVTGINVTLVNGGATLGDGSGGTDTLININNITGTRFGDSITGDSADNLLWGQDGNDTLSGGLGDDYLQGGQGADIIDGGDGRDNANFNDSNGVQGVNINLATGVAVDGFGDTDTLISIEVVSASQFDDILTGDDNDNSLIGNEGNDTITGGLGSDFMIGGAGDDLFVFDSSDTNAWDHVQDFTAGAGTEDQIDLSLVASLTNFADVQAAATDDLSGNTNIDLGDGNVLHLQGVDVNTLHSDDFLF